MNLTVNQIYQKSDSGLQFTEWLDAEKKLFKSKERAIDFETWLNARYERYITNRKKTGTEALKDLYEKFKDGSNEQLGQKPMETETPEIAAQQPGMTIAGKQFSPVKVILGIGITTVLIIGIYKIFKK